MKKIAVYGSLKKGFYNYRESMGDPIAHSTIHGAMFLVHSYPHLYPEHRSEDSEVREHPVEIYEIDDEQYNGIMGMELGAGYEAVDKSFLDSETGKRHDATIFFTRGNSSDSHYQYIEGYNTETVPNAVR